MIRIEEFSASIALLAGALDKEISTAGLQAYEIALGDLSTGELAIATERALRECRFMPSPAELRRLCGRPTADAQAAEAWEAVRQAVDVHDYTASVDFGPLVNAVVRNLGGWDRLCRLSREALNVWARKEFERVYLAFAPKNPMSLNGEPHRGAFRGPPIPVRIGGRLPDQQIEAAAGPMMAQALDLVLALADSKAAVG